MHTMLRFVIPSSVPFTGLSNDSSDCAQRFRFCVSAGKTIICLHLSCHQQKAAPGCAALPDCPFRASYREAVQHSAVQFTEEIFVGLFLDFFDRPHLREEGARIGDIPMLAELPIPKSEHVHDIILYPVARWRMIQKADSRVGSRNPVIHIDKIALGHNLDNSRAMVGNGREKAFVELDKSLAALVRIRIVLYVIIVHEPAHHGQVMLAEYFFVKVPDDLLVLLHAHIRSPPQVAGRWSRTNILSAFV
jgi:hypothetical protein